MSAPPKVMFWTMMPGMSQSSYGMPTWIEPPKTYTNSSTNMIGCTV